MAYIRADIKCPSAGRTITTQLYYPTDLPQEVGNKINGVITLLHGITNVGNDWMMYSAACRYAADNGYVLVAPNADNSFYTDMKYGSPFYTILTEELPAQLRAIFHLPDERDKNYIAGLSMGGYGAMLLGLSHPERYTAIGSFSGALDMGGMLQVAQAAPAMAGTFAPLYGESLALPPQADLMALAKNISALPAKQQPRLFVTCGEQDNDEAQILTQNQNFYNNVSSLPLDLTFKTWPGVHEWNFWDRSLADFIGFIQNSDYGKRKQHDWSTVATIH